MASNNTPEPATAEIVEGPGAPEAVAASSDGVGEDEQPTEMVSSPARVMRIGSMIKQLLEEVRRAPLDERGRSRLADIYETSVRDLAEVLSPDLRDELGRLTGPFETDTPSEAELRIAQAQLVGWLEGLFHGIQAMLFAQQMQSRQGLDEVRRPPLPPSSSEPPTEPTQGNYL